MSELTIITGSENIERIRQANIDLLYAFPDFLYNNTVINSLWKNLYTVFAKYQFLLCDNKDDSVLALGNCLPLAWHKPFEELPDGGIEWALKTGVEQAMAGESPNVLCAFQIIVSKEARGKGISYEAVNTMIEIGRSNGIRSLIAPVRPNRKSEYPLIPIDQYLDWRRNDGTPFDDWLRVHVKLGGKILQPCYYSFIITGKIVDWTQWTGLDFPGSGQYIIPGALNPITIEIENDRGLYVEPNIWVEHRV